MKRVTWWMLRRGWVIVLMGLVLAGTVQAQDSGPREIFIPTIHGNDAPATPAPTPVEGEPVYGMLGVLVEPRGRLYTTYLATADGTLYGLRADTAELDAQITALARSDTPTAKVWGNLLRGPGEAMIHVTGILGTEVLPQVGGASVPVAVVKFAMINVHAAPDSNAPVVGSVTINRACNITGRNRSLTWWEITCASGLRGWIDARLVEVQGSILGVPIVEWAVAPPTPAPTPTPMPTPTPTPVPPSGWRAEYFSNPRLSGSPAVVTTVNDVSFDWGNEPPLPGLPADNFSVRFERRLQVTPGFYRITAEADDGVRVWIDNQLVIDEWRGATNLVYAVSRVLTGVHDVRVEYYEASGAARIRVGFEPVNQAPAWDAAYFAGTGLSGAPVLTRPEPRSQFPLDYNWSYSSPDSGLIGTDYWSARWTGTFNFEGGNYQFRASADDGVRVYLDGLMVIDAWRDGYKELSNRFLGVGPGNHSVTVEYYDRTGPALVKVWWTRDAPYSVPQ